MTSGLEMERVYSGFGGSLISRFFYSLRHLPTYLHQWIHRWQENTKC